MAQQKLDIYRNDNNILNDSFEQAVMNIHVKKEQYGYKSIVICGCEAGDGTTTVAINLAAAFAFAGIKTLLIDGDIRKKRAYKHLNQYTHEGLSNYICGTCGLDEIIYETTTENLSYIPCGEYINSPLRTICSEKMDILKEQLDKQYDFIIYDMPAVNAAIDAKVIAVNSDAVILVSSLNKTSKKGLINAANMLTDDNINLIGTIINKVDMEEYKRQRSDYDYFNDEKYVKNSRNKKKRRKGNK